MLTGLDLVVVDFVVSLAVAIAPLILVIINMTCSLPLSYGHHVYYISLILSVLPVISTIQLPHLFSQLYTLPLYRMAGPLVSAVTLLISRQVANTDYWAPMERKKRSKWAY